MGPGLTRQAATSCSLPVATSKTKPRTESFFGMNGEALIRLIDWRTSSAGSGKAPAAHSGLMPVSSWIDLLNSSSVKVSRGGPSKDFSMRCPVTPRRCPDRGGSEAPLAFAA